MGNFKHGHMTDQARPTRTYQTWKAMKKRCENVNYEGYARYGARGIKVCERWQESFESFLADMGPAPKGYTIDRKDVNGNYEPGNCKWSSKKDQMRNTTKTRLIIYKGREMSLAEACEITGQTRTRVNARLRLGWTVERALTQPNRDG